MEKEIMTEWEAEALFESTLDETEEFVIVLGMTYSPSQVLKECDPIAFRVTFHDWIDSMSEEFLVEGYF